MRIYIATPVNGRMEKTLEQKRRVVVEMIVNLYHVVLHLNANTLMV